LNYKKYYRIVSKTYLIYWRPLSVSHVYAAAHATCYIGVTNHVWYTQATYLTGSLNKLLVLNSRKSAIFC